MVKPPKPQPPAPPVTDYKETARYLRPQPRQAIPPRQPSAPAHTPGALAHQLLGHRVVTKWEV